MTLFLKGFNNSNLLFREHTGVYTDIIHHVFKFLVTELVQVTAGECNDFTFSNTNFPRYSYCSILMIPGDHHYLNTCLFSLCNGLFGLFPWWIHHTHQTREDKVFFQYLLIFQVFLRTQFAVGKSKNTECVSSHFLEVFHCIFSVFGFNGAYTIFAIYLGTFLE